MKRNRFFISGDRPVKYIYNTGTGEAGIYGFNWDTGDFVLDMSYIDKLFRGDIDGAEEVTEQEFDKYVKNLKKKMGLP